MNIIICEVKFPDIQVMDFALNVIAKNMLSQVNDKGCSVTLVDSILDYKRYNSEVKKAGKYFVTSRGQCQLQSPFVAVVGAFRIPECGSHRVLHIL